MYIAIAPIIMAPAIIPIKMSSGLHPYNGDSEDMTNAHPIPINPNPADRNARVLIVTIILPPYIPNSFSFFSASGFCCTISWREVTTVPCCKTLSLVLAPPTVRDIRNSNCARIAPMIPGYSRSRTSDGAKEGFISIIARSNRSVASLTDDE